LIRIVFVFAVVIAALWLLRWFLKTPPSQVSNWLKGVLIYFGAGVLVLLAITGRLNWVIPLVGAMVAVFVRSLPHLVRYAPLLHRLWAQLKSRGSSSAHKTSGHSTVEARFLRMELDHQTGELDGQVLEGQFIGQHLHEMPLNQLVEFYKECMVGDQESGQLVEAYLDRVHGVEWKETFKNTGGEGGFNQTESSLMTKEEAFRILGLSSNASDDEIKQAHRRLIQKLHPDRGGSDYLAAKINQAKDVLLG